MTVCPVSGGYFQQDDVPCHNFSLSQTGRLNVTVGSLDSHGLGYQVEIHGDVVKVDIVIMQVLLMNLHHAVTSI